MISGNANTRTILRALTVVAVHFVSLICITGRTDRITFVVVYVLSELTST